MSQYYFFQVKSSNQYLNILNASNENGAVACQGVNDTTGNFRWAIIPAAGGYFFLQCQSSGQYLNILNASKANGAHACQGTNNTTDNFLWEFVSAADVPTPGVVPTAGTYFYLKVKSSGQYLNILNASNANGALACQGLNNTTPNFLWTLLPVPVPVTDPCQEQRQQLANIEAVIAREDGGRPPTAAQIAELKAAEDALAKCLAQHR